MPSPGLPRSAEDFCESFKRKASVRDSSARLQTSPPSSSLRTSSTASRGLARSARTPTRTPTTPAPSATRWGEQERVQFLALQLLNSVLPAAKPHPAERKEMMSKVFEAAQSLV